VTVSLGGAAVVALGVHAAIGLAVAVAFLLFGIARIDPAARGAHGFRLVVLPGLVLLWPLVVLRWRAALRDASPGRQR
jgi:hypothetical protein